MWPPWGKSSSRSLRTTHDKSNFSCSSFKDIQSILTEEPKKPSLFHRVRIAKSIIRHWSTQSHPLLPSPPPPPPPPPPGIVIYYTSLRVVRKTFEDCRTVRSILLGFRVTIDERDLSMDASFMKELQSILGLKPKVQISLPRIFIGGKYIGGADEVRQLHEAGELKKLIQDFPCETGVCEECGGYRFVLCYQCDGSHKFYSEKTGGGFRSCLDCNENGLVRCPSCSFGTSSPTA